MKYLRALRSAINVALGIPLFLFGFVVISAAFFIYETAAGASRAAVDSLSTTVEAFEFILPDLIKLIKNA